MGAALIMVRSSLRRAAYLPDTDHGILIKRQILPVVPVRLCYSCINQRSHQASQQRGHLKLDGDDTVTV